MHYADFRSMNCDILLAASGGDLATIQEGFARARDFIELSEKRFTRFSATSELAQLNRTAGDWYQASPAMYEVIQQAYDLSAETDGLFNPAILPALMSAGYDRSMDEIRSQPPRLGSTQVMELVDFRLVQLDPATHSILLPDGMQVDLGGIAKGWIAEQAAHMLEAYCTACAVNAGGDMFLINQPPGETGWEVGLENPLDPEQDLAILRVRHGAVATSSVAKRKWQHNGKLQHHLIDPRSGLPAHTEWLSVTVWAEHATQAEVYAKALLIGGQGAAQQLLKNKPSIAYLTVDKRGWVQGSDNIHEVFHV